METAKYSIFEIRKRAVRAACLYGLLIANVAIAYQVNRSTIHRWVARYKIANGDQGLVRKPVMGRPRILSNVDDDGEWLSIVLNTTSIFGYETDLLGKIWALRGKTPVQKVMGNCGGVSAMSAISKSDFIDSFYRVQCLVRLSSLFPAFREPVARKALALCFQKC